MLLLKRKPTESIIIGDDIKVTVIKVHGDEVQLGVKAPSHVRIDREEVRADRNRRRKTGLMAAFFLFFAGLLQGADYVTVTGHVSSAQSLAFTNEYLTFTPDNNGPILNPPLLISAGPVRTTSTPPVGFFEINLEQGVYKVQIGRDRRNTFQITIPAETTETNHISGYVTSGATTNFIAGGVSGWTQSAANARFVGKTNSWSTGQTLTNAFFDGSTNVFRHTNGASSGYVLKSDGEYAYWSAAGGGESTTVSHTGGTNANQIGVMIGLSGTDIEFRTVQAGANMVITNEGTNLVLASTASGSGGSTTGATNSVVVYSDTGTITEYIATADTDAARGQALTNALDAAASGDIVSIGPGVFAFDTGFYYINTNKTIALKGAGKNATKITADVVSQGVIWNKNSGIMTIDSLTVSNENASGIGLKNDEDMTLVNVRSAGLADGVTMAVNAQSRGDDTGCKLLAYDTEFWTGWDGLVVASTNAVVDLFNCYFKGYAVSLTDVNGIGITSPGGVLRMYGGAVDLTYTNGVSNSIGVSASGTSTVELYGVKIFTDQGGAVATSDLAQGPPATLKVGGTSYDPSNVTGTITPIMTPYSVSGDTQGIVVTQTTNSNGVIDFDLDIAKIANVTNMNHFGSLTNTGDIIPSANVTYDLGFPTLYYKYSYIDETISSNLFAWSAIKHQAATGDRVAIFTSSKFLTNSAAVDTTELEYLDGVTQNVHTSFVTLSNKLSVAGGSGGITVVDTVDVDGNVTWTVSDDDAGGGATTNFVTTTHNRAEIGDLHLTNTVDFYWAQAAGGALTWSEGARQIIVAGSDTNYSGPDMSGLLTNREPMIVAFVQDGTGSHALTHNGTTIPTRQGANAWTFVTVYPGPDASTNAQSDVTLTVDGTVVDNFIDLDSGGEITVTDSSGTITWTIKDDIIAAANFADGDWGDVSVSGNSVTLDDDVVAPAEMADADHGDFTYSGGVATIDSGTTLSSPLITTSDLRGVQNAGGLLVTNQVRFLSDTNFNGDIGSNPDFDFDLALQKDFTNGLATNLVIDFVDPTSGERIESQIWGGSYRETPSAASYTVHFTAPTGSQIIYLGGVSTNGNSAFTLQSNQVAYVSAKVVMDTNIFVGFTTNIATISFP